MKDNYHEFRYNNLGGSEKNLNHEISAWGRRMEAEGRLPAKWCLMKGEICVIGNVDMRGEKLIYPFGTVAGEFLCDDDQKSSPNYPSHVTNVPYEDHYDFAFMIAHSKGEKKSIRK